jgi:hypothetical protein
LGKIFKSAAGQTTSVEIGDDADSIAAGKNGVLFKISKSDSYQYKYDSSSTSWIKGSYQGFIGNQVSLGDGVLWKVDQAGKALVRYDLSTDTESTISVDAVHVAAGLNSSVFIIDASDDPILGSKVLKL